MTMHLEGPWLSTTGKRKGKIKFASAEAKRKSEQLDKEWKELLKRQGLEQEDRKRKRALSAEPLDYRLTTPVGRTNTHHIPSLNTGGNATLAPAKVYTGDQVLGVTVLHKSCLQPVFSKQDAIDAAKMRR